MCEFCKAGLPHRETGTSRRNILKSAMAGATAAALFPTLLNRSAEASELPKGVGTSGRRTLVKGGYILSQDPSVGDFVGDVLVEGQKILKVAPSVEASDAAVINAKGRVVMPGFVDTHHHQFETALRSFLPNGIMFADPTRSGEPNYLDDILGKFSKVYRPEDVYIAELFGGLSQLDAGVTTVLDVSQIHHSPEHSNAVIEGMKDVGRRGVFGYFEGYGPDLAYPQDARRIRDEYFASDDQLLTMLMGGEAYLPNIDPLDLWNLGKELDLMVGLHVVGSLGMQETMDRLIPHYTDKHLFIHMTGMSDRAWDRAKEVGAHVSLSVPIEMQMRHGMPPIQKAIDMGMDPSLSVDVECTMTSDFFTQMRSAITLQRAMANQQALEDGPENAPALLHARDVLKLATINGAKGLKLDHKTGSLTPGKEADIILLDAEALNVAPLNNAPGAVVTLMERSNVETVMVAGQIKKWQGQLVGQDIAALRDKITASRDYLFEAAGIEIPLFD
ncbi:amidohydrolase family protein [Cohaesibacter marisflavi]|uniref:amidohydrolase family protein n=1 Tax=Cohaesibacter marisflavi TaxID=655353 RepID=UPI0029C79B23|nr:amidohydrolase family protein [Cohaesibacter marisflavi]